MSPWVVGKPVPYVAEKAPPCIHLKAISDHARECYEPTLLAYAGGGIEKLRCLYIDERLRDCSKYDCGDPNDKRALKQHDGKKKTEPATDVP